MAATKGATGSGVTVSIGTPGTGETFTTILQIRSISWTQPKLNTEDASCLSSPTLGAATIKEYLPTVIEPGQFSGNAIYLPADAGLAAANAAFLASTIRDFKVQFPPLAQFSQTTTGNLYTFSGFVLEQPLPDGIDVSKILSWKLTVQITTAVTVTVGS